jgi:hypothetical protein
MVSYSFDITDKCIKFVSTIIKGMPGNAGQETLVERTVDSAYGRVIVTVFLNEEEGVEIQASGEIHWPSDHPEAIEIILKTADDNTELIIYQANIPGPWALVDAIRTGNWKIVGWDT